MKKKVLITWLLLAVTGVLHAYAGRFAHIGPAGKNP